MCLTSIAGGGTEEGAGVSMSLFVTSYLGADWMIIRVFHVEKA